MYLIQYSSFSFCGPNVRRHQILTYPEQNQSVASIHCPQLKPYRTLKRFYEKNYHVNHAAWISNNWLFSSNCNLPIFRYYWKFKMMDISNIRWIVLIVVIFGNEIDPATDIPVIDNEIVKWDDVKCNIQLFGISNFRVRQNI